MARRAGAVTMGTVSGQVCKKGYRSLSSHGAPPCPGPGPASYGYLALYRSLQKETLIISGGVRVGAGVGVVEKGLQTWNSVVQDEPKESSNEHVCCEEHHDHLVQLFDSFQQRR